ncbi:hypothetical protein CLHOM_14790 [Clostridium homopropionicum DSM 5847]|uniref:Uncharacterized protein n=1 Tax=Clostridium homopropionicum DSM 5847 TaxID=1121318 RepID=A0A0L6ZAV8_9CLOT|nr:hypothetical protein [Clostridium homopropionicum]KOA20109.1 hypothetical protein CLHOM_14790 [Clostridium homopropionicum DSM 5847]SFG98946.1 hypothetical protein SAMN04488501_13112 [Clostridium homopropionicum]
MAVFQPFTGIVTMINDFFVGSGESSGCYKLMSVENQDGSLVNFVVSPNTYFINHVTVRIGDRVTGFYDTTVPVPLIYPPQYGAVVMTRDTRYRNVKVDYFNEQLISSDGFLKLNISPYTRIILENDQLFTGNLANRNLIVVYGPTTRSIPAQTTPYKIIVMC